MASRLNPYLSFDGNAREAMEFYATVFGGSLALDTYGQYGGGGAADADRIVHGRLETSEGYTIMAGDVAGGMEFHPMRGCSVSLSGDDAGLLRGYWAKLSEGATITMPLREQVWGDEFGMCVDRFGISWMVNISRPAAG